MLYMHNFELKKNLFLPTIESSVFSASTLEAIILLIERMINAVEPSSPPAPLNDDLPYFYYRTSINDHSRNLLHLVVSTWNTGNKLQDELLALLEPLRLIYLKDHPYQATDAYGMYPSRGRCSRYSFNVYPANGYIDSHTDDVSKLHPWQVLALISNPFKHKTLIDTNGSLKDVDELVPYNVGSVLKFDPSKTHTICAAEANFKLNTWEPKLNVSNCRVDCSYVNLSEHQVNQIKSRL